MNSDLYLFTVSEYMRDSFLIENEADFTTFTSDPSGLLIYIPGFKFLDRGSFQQSFL